MRQQPLHRRSGQSLVEIGALLALVSLTAILGLGLIGTNLNAAMCQIVIGLGGKCEDLLFRDPFDNLNGWTTKYGNWNLENGKLCGGPRAGSIYRPIEADNYRIKVDQSTLISGYGYGVFFRASNFDSSGSSAPVGKVNGYSFQYDPGFYPGQFIIRKWTNGTEAAPFARVNAPSGFVWSGVDRQIELEVVGNTFAVSLDGEEILRATDNQNPYMSGDMGFRTWNADSKACFDDLSVEALP
ncbi:family 16 glycoside hydrolase [Candidatus Chloroploca sp. Khr17]|uniref:family 16 glycoside hydrolase n=1 Tax=Candidatus Chloroploca sp. Khr17 TaxID=2496869 RepID=UPI00101BA103|nr:family 16 glycoside hydrolase [Candidatus Chloroploca sp. Khr17]